MGTDWKKIEKIKAFGSTPEELWIAAIEYFKWCEENPLYKGELMRGGSKQGTFVKYEVPRPFTISELCLHLGIAQDYLYSGVKSEDRTSDFFLVCSRILAVIETQLLQYSIIGTFNSVIVQKKLGLNNTTDTVKAAPNITIQVDGKELPKLRDREPVEGEWEILEEEFPKEQKTKEEN